MSQDNNNEIEVTNNKKKKNNKRLRDSSSKSTPVQSQIESQLASLFVRARVAEGHFRDIRELGQEGVDHININRFSKTTLGYLLSTGAKLDFQVLGKKYSSIGNLIAYYKSHCTNESVVMATGDTSPHFSSEDFERFPQFSNLYAIVCLGYWDIIKNNASLFNALEINDIPLDSYVERKGIRARHQTTNILISAIKEAHSAVKGDRDPRLNAFIFDATLRALQRESQRDNVYMETLIAEMFKPETVREAYMKAHGNARLKEQQAKAEEAKKSSFVPEVNNIEVATPPPVEVTEGPKASDIISEAIDLGDVTGTEIGSPTETTVIEPNVSTEEQPS